MRQAALVARLGGQSRGKAEDQQQAHDSRVTCGHPKWLDANVGEKGYVRIFLAPRGKTSTGIRARLGAIWALRLSVAEAGVARCGLAEGKLRFLHPTVHGHR